ncbi:MAG TPA: hypothetical protein DGH68_11105 [Bacteroidetes bacterium]|jgi:uncharacterized membrane protein|nr:hypothetical protein [Bacteroidota bacterium]
MQQPIQRIRFLDIMRGVAVVVMVIGHSVDSVLSLDARSTEAFRMYDAVRGFTAPIFLFVAGFAFIVVTERRWNEYHAFSRPLRSRLLKVLLLLTVGYVLHLPFLSFNKLLHGTKPEEYALLFQVDVLHCVAVSIVILQVLVLLSKTPRIFGLITLKTTAIIVLATPLVWTVDLARVIGPVLAPYFSQKTLSIFPIFPFSGFMLSGGALGHFFLVAWRNGREKEFFGGIITLALMVGACGVLFDLLPVSIYPPHDYWKVSPNFFLVRMSAVLLVTAGFFYLKKLPGIVEHPVLALGQASLLVYAVHLGVAYGSPLNIGLQQIIGKILPYYAAAGVSVVVLGGMVVLVYLSEYFRTHHEWPSRLIQAGFASTITYFFFTNPW